MPGKTGKRFEYDVASEYGDPFLAMLQDYDWADEVLHAQIGRKHLEPRFASGKEQRAAAEALLERWNESMERMARERYVTWEQSEQALQEDIQLTRRDATAPTYVAAPYCTFTASQLALFHPGVKRFVNPHRYPVGLEQQLFAMKTELVLRARGVNA